jgi:hypothetical protein
MQFVCWLCLQVARAASRGFFVRKGRTMNKKQKKKTLVATVQRFTGSEIWADAESCAEEAHDLWQCMAGEAKRSTQKAGA